ncbi:hypothetical protein [Aureispira sp. CCB-QB1]|uniref:hypothetical protein n=1 Tax=Aureispira sp. CCB-QB1 TaxID=1313421 RepID=UPI0012DBFB16|nr:hypothetical protein [Aureispira sp. CCB-QB1]
MGKPVYNITVNINICPSKKEDKSKKVVEFDPSQYGLDVSEVICQIIKGATNP